ncbi:hypothetical protein BC832DRAFT_567895 [Gaertneriomyces semiglobifer]|nr:hypothetical protein BC832DRAFT_567895 [Gaertneriomyces semiglobifer]
MFLERVHQLGLLDHDPESNILGFFPLPIKKTLIKEVTQCLLPGNAYVSDPASMLSSPAHVKWAMEVVGQGFALPIEDHGIMRMTTEVYEVWLANGRPKGVSQGGDILQRFWQTIFEHFSMVFQPRARVNTQQTSSYFGARTKDTSEMDNDVLGLHIDLCHRILNALVNAGRVLGDDFSDATWTVLVKVLLGVADCLLDERGTRTPPEDEAARRMADELIEHIIRALVELWLRSKIQSVHMWNHLKMRFSRWTHRVEVVRQWSATILSLTRRVINFLYGPGQGESSILLEMGNQHIELELPPDFVYYSWHRMTYMLGDPNTLPPANFEVAIMGVSRIVQEWHMVGYDAEPLDEIACGVPDGNTILYMFGGWLFESALKVGPEYAVGKAEALGVLCRIFSQPQRRKSFAGVYLEQYYAAVRLGLTDDNHVLTSIIMNSGELFTRELDGLRVLIPDFIFALRKVLPVLKTGVISFVDPDELRRGAYRLISTIMALPNHLERFPIGKWKDNAGAILGDVIVSKTIYAMYAQNDSANSLEGGREELLFRELKPYLVELLLASLNAETNTLNARFLLHSLVTFVAEDAVFCPGLPALVIRSIHEKLTSGWDAEIVKAAFHALNQLVAIYDFNSRENKSCPRDLVLSLCRYIDFSLEDETLVAAQSRIVAAYESLIRWAVSGNWIINDPECHAVVLSTLSRGIGILDRQNDFAVISSGLATHFNQSTPGPIIASATSGNLKELANGATTLDRDRIASSAGTTTTGATEKKKPQRHAMSAAKLIPKLRSALPTTVPVSTGSKDGGFGLPTFASLTAEMMVKAAAEVALNHLTNHLGHFPPSGERTGVARVSSMWKEVEEVKKIVAARRTLQTSEKPAREPKSPLDDDVANALSDDVSLEDFKKYVRYYAYDRRLIIGFVDTPAWAYQHSNDGHRKATPTMTLIVRDSSGKYTWQTSMKYVDDKESAPRQLNSDNSQLISPSGSQDFLQTSGIPITAPAAASVTSFVPPSYPYNPRRSRVVHCEAVNEGSIPSVNDLLPVGSREVIEQQRIQRLTEQLATEENAKIKRILNSPDYAKNVHISPPAPLNLYDPDTTTQTHRFFLATMGYLTPETLSRLCPLRISDNMLKELQKVDGLSERDSVTISVLFCRSDRDTSHDMLRRRSVSQDFVEFLHSLGWPVALETHPGFKGNLESTNCETAPYYADRYTEVIFHSPYLLKSRDPPGTQGTISSSPATSPSRLIDVPPTLKTPSPAALSLSRMGSDSPHTPPFHKSFADIAKGDIVCIVWIEDVRRYTTVQQKLTKAGITSQLFIFIHPMQRTPGLYLIKLLPTTTSQDDLLAAGPLLDGMIVSRRALGILVRLTAISGHKHCRSIKGSYRRPSLLRRHHIEEICNRHKSTLSVARLYADLFT